MSSGRPGGRYGVRMLRVGPEGVELCIDEYGDPADPLVLLIAGAASSYDWWDVGLCEALAAGGRRVVRYDHRDTGHSVTGRPGSPAYGAGALQQDCADLVVALGGEPAHLVGLSMGGGIAQALALTRPELVASVTLVATTAVGGVDGTTLPGPTAELGDYFSNPPPEPDWTDQAAVVEWLVAAERVFAGPGFDEDRARAIAAEVVDRSIDPAAAGNHWLAVGGDDGPALDAYAICVPTLVVHGRNDPMFPVPHGEALAAAVPAARLLTVEQMGHQVPPSVAWPDVVAEVIALGD